MPEAVWDGAVRRKLAVREAGTCRQHSHPSTRPPEQVIAVFMAKYEEYNEGHAVTGYTRTKVSVTLDLTEQKS